MHDEPVGRETLQESLGQLSLLLRRIESAYARYDETLNRYLQPERKLWTPWGARIKRIVLVAAVAVIALNSASINLFMYTAFAAVLILAAGGVFLLVRGGSARRFAIYLLCDAVLIAFLIVSGGQVIGLQLTAWLILVALVAAVVLAVKIRDAYLPAVNQRIAKRNQEAQDAAYESANPELAAIEQEIADVQRSYRALAFNPRFPEKYLDVTSVNALWHIVNDARADTLKEAINLYHQDLHNQYMRDVADQQAALAQMMLAEQQRTTHAVQFASVMNLGMQAFQGSRTRSAIHAEGVATRAALNSGRTIRFTKG